MQFPAGSPYYRGYLLRFWQEHDQRNVQVVWRFSLDDPHSGERRGFASFDQLIGALQSEMEAAGVLLEPHDNVSGT